jgi:DNA-binding FadR family transcriptional regulator
MSGDGVEPAFRRLESALPLHKTVQHEIRNYIIKQGLRPGDPLKPESELARMFGVSRNSVREAVKALESTGVLETRRGSGVYVRAFSFAPLLDHLPYGLMQGRRALNELVALRKALEAGLITDAMRVVSEPRVAAMREVLAEMHALAEQDQPFPEQDRRFHRLLFADLGNEMLLSLFDLFWLAFHHAAPPMRGRTPMDAYQAHARILDAILTGDPDQARAAVHDHYAGIESRLSEDAPEAGDVTATDASAGL